MLLFSQKNGVTLKLHSIYRFIRAMTTEPAAAPQSPMPDERQIRDALRAVIDPEIGRNIVALGLLYRIEIVPDHLLIEMTMTSPACPLSETILGEVHAALAKILPPTIKPEVQVVWEPPWDASMMDEETKQHFGWEPD